MVVELARFPCFNESLGRQIYPLMAARARSARASLAQWYLCEKSVPSSCWRYTVRTRGEGLRLRGGTWHCSQTNRTRDIVAQLLDATVWGPRVADEVASRSRLFGRPPPGVPRRHAAKPARRASNPWGDLPHLTRPFVARHRVENALGAQERSSFSGEFSLSPARNPANRSFREESWPWRRSGRSSPIASVRHPWRA